MDAARPAKRHCTAAFAADADADTAAILLEESPESVQAPAVSVINADTQPPARYMAATYIQTSLYLLQEPQCARDAAKLHFAQKQAT